MSVKINFKQLRRLLIVTLCFLSMISFAQKPTLTVLSQSNFPPFSFEEKGVMTGIDIDVIHELGNRMNFEIIMKYVPWKRLLKTLENGRTDAGFALFYTEERAKFALYATLEPIHYSSFFLFVKKGSEFKFSRIQDLYNKKIGLQSSFSISDEFDIAVKEKKFNIHNAYSNENNINLLLKGRVDAIIGHEIVTYYNAAKLDVLEKISLLPIPVAKKRPAYLVLSKSSNKIKNKAELLDTINKIMSEIKQDGTYQKIVHKYIQIPNK